MRVFLCRLCAVCVLYMSQCSTSLCAFWEHDYETIFGVSTFQNFLLPLEMENMYSVRPPQIHIICILQASLLNHLEAKIVLLIFLSRQFHVSGPVDEWMIHVMTKFSRNSELYVDRGCMFNVRTSKDVTYFAPSIMMWNRTICHSTLPNRK